MPICPRAKGECPARPSLKKGMWGRGRGTQVGEGGKCVVVVGQAGRSLSGGGRARQAGGSSRQGGVWVGWGQGRESLQHHVTNCPGTPGRCPCLGSVLSSQNPIVFHKEGGTVAPVPKSGASPKRGRLKTEW